MILAFIDEMRAEGYAVESILRVLRQQGLAIAARTYRGWKRPARIADTVTDALVEDKIRELAWTVNQVIGQVQMTPEDLYGRRKWVPLLRPPARPRGHLPWCGGPGDAHARSRGHPPTQEGPHHYPWRELGTYW